MFRRLALIGLAFFNIELVAPSPAQADDPPANIMSVQDLCNLIYPGSQAMANPSEFGAACVKQDLVPIRAARGLPTLVVYALEPGKDPELPIGSVRVDPDDPLSNWIIPDCDVPERNDCQ